MAVYEDLESIYAWIDEIPLSRCKKNLTRDFADGVLMAEVCKQLFPKLVDLHNYPPANSHAAKVVNWETLNRKVFSKLQIRVTKDLIHQIAAGVPGALESVLMAIRNKTETHKSQSSSCMSPSGNSDRGDMNNGDPISPCVLAELKKLKTELQMKNETITVLNQKVTHLENLLEMKDKRLKELAANVERLQARSQDSQDSFCTVTD